MNAVFWWCYVCHVKGNLNLDDYGAYCAGRSLDNNTEWVLTT